MRIVNALVIAAALLLGGCSPAAEKPTATPCERFNEAFTRLSPNPRSTVPEVKDMWRVYQSKRAGTPLPPDEFRKIQKAFFGLHATTYRDIAADTTDQGLHDALILMADDYQQAADTTGMLEQKGLKEALEACPRSGGTTAGSPSAGG